MFKQKLKVGERRACAAFDVTLCWCAACCGQTARGYIRRDGRFLSTGGKGSCEDCKGLGRVWVPTEKVIELLPFGNGAAVNLVTPQDPLRTIQYAPADADALDQVPQAPYTAQSPPMLLAFVRWLCGSGSNTTDIYW